MTVLITCGPSFEPVDRVRRLTNASTGELGVRLAEAFAAEGFEVLCLKGSGASHPHPPPPCATRVFGTNEDLRLLLRGVADSTSPVAVFHSAALCDFRVTRAESAEGTLVNSAKIPSRGSGLRLYLEPVPKLIGELRGWFPRSLLVGWKYEADGDRAAALARGRQQISQYDLAACAVNGPAYGVGFGFCEPPGQLHELPSKAALARFLPGWLRNRLG